MPFEYLIYERRKRGNMVFYYLLMNTAINFFKLILNMI